MTADDLLCIPRGTARHELVRGELRTMSLFEIPEAFAVTELAHSLRNYAHDRRLGSVLPTIGYQLESNPDNVRGPAVSFITGDRVEAIGRIPGYWPEAPALAVEVHVPRTSTATSRSASPTTWSTARASSGCSTPAAAPSPPTALATGSRCSLATTCSTREW